MNKLDLPSHLARGEFLSLAVLNSGRGLNGGRIIFIRYLRASENIAIFFFADADDHSLIPLQGLNVIRVINDREAIFDRHRGQRETCVHER